MVIRNKQIWVLELEGIDFRNLGLSYILLIHGGLPPLDVHLEIFWLGVIFKKGTFFIRGLLHREKLYIIGWWWWCVCGWVVGWVGWWLIGL